MYVSMCTLMCNYMYILFARACAIAYASVHVCCGMLLIACACEHVCPFNVSHPWIFVFHTSGFLLVMLILWQIITSTCLHIFQNHNVRASIVQAYIWTGALSCIYESTPKSAYIQTGSYTRSCTYVCTHGAQHTRTPTGMWKYKHACMTTSVYTYVLISKHNMCISV